MWTAACDQRESELGAQTDPFGTAAEVDSDGTIYRGRRESRLRSSLQTAPICGATSAGATETYNGGITPAKTNHVSTSRMNGTICYA